MTVIHSKMFKVRPLQIVLAVLLGLAVSSCADSTGLAGLKADPMASFEPSGSELVFTDNQDEGTTLGKPTHARVMRSYLIIDRDQADVVLAEAVAYAESVGWVIEQNAPERFQGSRALEAGPGDLRISLHPSDSQEPGGPLRLTVIIDYRRPGEPG